MNVSTISRKPGSRVTAIITAMPEEAAALRAALRDVRKVHDVDEARAQPASIHVRGRVGRKPGHRKMVRGQLGRSAVALAITGDGERNASVHAERMFAALHGEVERLLIIGVAGALNPGLRAGDLVVADEVRAEAGGDTTTLLGDRAWALHAARHAGAKHGVALSALSIADTASEKQRLLSLCNAAGRPCIVDLESFAYAREAEKRGVPWLVLRAISDTADESLPEVLNRSRDAGGAVLRSRVLRSLLTDPRPLPKLLLLSRRVARASVLLANATAAVVSHLLPTVVDQQTVRSS